jgi:hypothetical protein
VLSLVIGFVVTIPGAMHQHRHRVNASVEAPRPHDFSVRTTALSSKAQRASIASRTNVRDDRETPSDRGGTGEALRVICPSV